MEKGSETTTQNAKTGAQVHKPCAGGMPQTDNTDTWFVAIVKKHNEIRCQDFLNKLTSQGYPVESYVANQQILHFYSNRTRRLVNHIVIPGKIFIRVNEEHRQDLLKLCPLLSYYKMDPARVTASGSRDFARVSDIEIQRLRDILASADGPVEYLETPPKSGDKIQVLSGRFHGLKGYVLEDADKKFAIIILDQLGSFRIKIPTKDLGQIV